MIGTRALKKGTAAACVVLGVLVVAGSASATSIARGVTYNEQNLSQATAIHDLRFDAKPADPEIIRRWMLRKSSAIYIYAQVPKITPDWAGAGWEQLQDLNIELWVPNGRQTPTADISLGYSINPPGAQTYDNNTSCRALSVNQSIPGGSWINLRSNTYGFQITDATFARCGFKRGQRIWVYGQSYLSVDNAPAWNAGKTHVSHWGEWWANDSQDWYAFTY